MTKMNYSSITPENYEQFFHRCNLNPFNYTWLRKIWKVCYLCIYNSSIYDSDKSDRLVGDLSAHRRLCAMLQHRLGFRVLDLMNRYTSNPDACLYIGHDYFRKRQYQMTLLLITK